MLAWGNQIFNCFFAYQYQPGRAIFLGGRKTRGKGWQKPSNISYEDNIIDFENRVYRLFYDWIVQGLIIID